MFEELNILRGCRRMKDIVESLKYSNHVMGMTQLFLMVWLIVLILIGLHCNQDILFIKNPLKKYSTGTELEIGDYILESFFLEIDSPVTSNIQI